MKNDPNSNPTPSAHNAGEPQDKQNLDLPTCGKCGEVMTPETASIHPEFFLHDRCLPPECLGEQGAERTKEAEATEMELLPCPFCGGKELDKLQTFEQPPCIKFVRCQVCKYGWLSTEEWNTRQDAGRRVSSGVSGAATATQTDSENARQATERETLLKHACTLLRASRYALRQMSLNPEVDHASYFDSVHKLIAVIEHHHDAPYEEVLGAPSVEPKSQSAACGSEFSEKQELVRDLLKLWNRRREQIKSNTLVNRDYRDGLFDAVGDCCFDLVKNLASPAPSVERQPNEGLCATVLGKIMAGGPEGWDAGLWVEMCQAIQTTVERQPKPEGEK